VNSLKREGKMPNITAIAGIVAGILSFAAYIPLVLAIKSKKARPNRATWIIWSMVTILITISYYASGARDTIWVPLIYGICSFIIAILSLKHGEGGWTPFDRWCLAGAGLSALLWWCFNSPLIALFMNVTIDFIGALPTIRKSYHDPESEDRITWGLFFAGSIANVFAINKWTFVIALYPILQVVIIGIIAGLVFKRRK